MRPSSTRLAKTVVVGHNDSVADAHMTGDKIHSPTVSVGIPTYKGAPFLRRAIQSVLSQTYTNLELIIIDDNSPDATRTIVSEIHDPRVRYIQNSHNLGVQGNWNRCLEESRGIYVKILPQDDMLHPTCIEKQVAVFDHDPTQQISLVFCARSIVDNKDNVIMRRRYCGVRSGVVPGPRLVETCIRRGTNVIGEPGGVLFRRSLAIETGPFDATIPYVIDLDYWVRLLTRGEGYYLPESLVSFRVSKGSWSVAIGNRQALEFSMFIDKTAKIPDLELPRWEMLAGKAMARINNGLRMAMYRWVLR